MNDQHRRLSIQTDKALVSFSDLSGFKKIMLERAKAEKALGCLYQTAYNHFNQEITGIAISDCVISWIDAENDFQRKLVCISDLAKIIHRKMIDEGFLMQTSIAYGEFYFEERKQRFNLQKNKIMGKAYLDAWFNNEKIPKGSIVFFAKDVPKPHSPLWIGSLSGKVQSWEYFWSVNNPSEIEAIKNSRKEIQKRFSTKKKNLEDEMFSDYINLYARNS